MSGPSKSRLEEEGGKMFEIHQAGVEIREEWESDEVQVVLGGQSFAPDDEIDLLDTACIPIGAHFDARA